jgi:RNA polymerase sigma-70 factor (ECF subfamily)
MTSPGPDTEELLQRSSAGDRGARGALLQRHRARLKRMVSLRMDRRLAALLDPSDVVQEVLAEADRRLDDYARERPLPFYPWLRQLACDRLADAYRRHVRAARRSVTREEGAAIGLPESSAEELAARLLARGSEPGEAARREELRQGVRAALAALSERDREVLILRHLEQLSAGETAAVLGLTEAAAKSRALRAMQRLRALLGPEASEGGR